MCHPPIITCNATRAGKKPGSCHIVSGAELSCRSAANHSGADQSLSHWQPALRSSSFMAKQPEIVIRGCQCVSSPIEMISSFLIRSVLFSPPTLLFVSYLQRNPGKEMIRNAILCRRSMSSSIISVSSRPQRCSKAPSTLKPGMKASLWYSRPVGADV